MLASFRWVSSHYSQANHVPYGFVPPEPGGGNEDISLLRRVLVYVPAALPIVAIALSVWMKARRSNVNANANILLAAGLALAAACYPRVATNNLLFAAPLLLCFEIVAGASCFQPKTYRVALLIISGLSLTGISGDDNQSAAF